MKSKSKKKGGGIKLSELKKLSASQLAREIKRLQKNPQFKEEIQAFIKETTA